MSANERSVATEYRIFGDQPDDVGRPVTVVIADDQALVRSGFRLILKAAGLNVVAEAATGEEAVTAVRAQRPDVVLMDVRMPVMDGIEATRRILSDFPPTPTGNPAGGLRDASRYYQNGGVPRIIILTTFDLDEYVYAALAAGASGFLLKDVTPEHLVAAVQLVRTGDALLAPQITRRLVERFASAPAAPAPGAQHAVGPTGPPGAVGTGGAGTAADPRATQSAPGTAGAGTEGSVRPGTGAAGRPGYDVSALTPRELEVLGLVARGLSNAEIAAEFVLSEATVKTHVARILTKLNLRDRVQAVVLAYETGLISPAS